MRTIAVDIDEVLAHFNRALAKSHNEQYGTNHTEQDYHTDEWSKVWGVDNDEVERRVAEFLKADIHATLEPVQDALVVLKKLKIRFNLEVITVRRESTVAITQTWLRANFPDIFSNVHFIHFWDKADTRTKVSVCEDIGADWLIDDSVKHVTQMAQAGRQGILFGDYTWNQSSNLLPGIERTKNWSEVERYFNEQPI